MSHRLFVALAIAISPLMPVALAQKPAPAPPPSPSPSPGRLPTSTPPGSDTGQPRTDLVMFLRGRVAIKDGSPMPHDMLVERLCNSRVRQEVYASAQGDFSMQLGSRVDSFPEGSAEDNSSPSPTNRDTSMGIPRRALTNCELRASASGFRSRSISLMEVDTFSGNVDVGTIIVERSGKPEGATVSALPYKAPKDARKAYEKGLQAERHGNLADAHKYFETTVKLYPKSANAWFQFGSVLRKENDNDAARKAFTQATSIDTKFLPPYLSLASMDYQTANWPELRDLTSHILDLDPLNRAASNTYILDLDPMNYTDAYYYNAIANYRLNRFEDAEKSALKAEHLDLFTHFPQVHLLLADIFARKNNYPIAIAQIQTYLALDPRAPDADQAREHLAKLEKLNNPAPITEKQNQP
jgi:tetratricopeptide (TPR) repeat protein